MPVLPPIIRRILSRPRPRPLQSRRSKPLPKNSANKVSVGMAKSIIAGEWPRPASSAPFEADRLNADSPVAPVKQMDDIELAAFGIRRHGA